MGSFARVIKDNIIQIFKSERGFPEAVSDPFGRKSGIMLFAGKTLFLGSCHNFPIDYQSSSTVMITQSTQMSFAMCRSIRPDYKVFLFQQFNYNGRTNYILNISLESDPAALQALDSFRVLISRYWRITQPADKFVSRSLVHNFHITSKMLCFGKF